ncbi:MAG: hypothetical protein JNM72_14720 [Deltaproteobacteria bacterium]|nr:hypothetical protein [Deltaproteobacteria bacterium]
MSRAALQALTAALVCAALVGAVITAGPPSALLSAARAAAAAGLCLVGALGLGAPIAAGRGAALTLGLGLLGLLGVLALAAGLPPGLALLGGAGLGLAIGASKLRTLTQAPAAGAIAALTLCLVAAPTALAPPTDTDALYQHLGLGARMLHEGALVGGPLSPDGSRPLLLIGLWAGLLQLGGPAGAALTHLGVAAAVLLQISVLGERAAGRTGALLGPALFGLSWTVLHEAPVVGNNLPVALALTAAADAARAGRAWRCGLLLGLALSFKYTAALGVPLVLLSGLRPGGALRALGVAGACLAPWWLRNVIDGLHPLFPYAGWALPDGQALPFQHLEKYGAGRGAADFALLPWRVVFSAERDSFRFLGQLHPAMLPALGLALLGGAGPGQWPRRLGLALGLAGWAAGPQWLRHLLPLLPLLVISALEGLVHIGLASTSPGGPRWPARLWVGLALVGAPQNLWPALSAHAGRAAAALDPAAAAALRAEQPAAAATAWANAHLEGNAVVGLVRSWDLLGIERRSRLGSVEDHTPLRVLLLRAPDDPFAPLRAAGVTHLLVGPPAFLRAGYPFLSAADYKAMYDAPEVILEEALLREATLLFEAEGARVYRLDLPRPGRAIPGRE